MSSPWVSRQVHELVVQRAADQANDLAAERYEHRAEIERWTKELANRTLQYNEASRELATVQARAAQLQADIDQAWAQCQRYEGMVDRSMAQVDRLVTEMAALKREGFSRHTKRDEERADQETAESMSARELDMRKIQSTITEFVAQGDPQYREIYRYALAELDRGTAVDRVLAMIRMGYQDGPQDDIEEIIPEEEPEPTEAVA